MNTPPVAPAKARAHQSAATSGPRAHLQLRGNLLGRIAAFIISLVVGLWFPPYLIHHLGLAVYGLVPLANQLTSYTNVLNTAFTTSIGRYLTLDLSRGDDDAATRTLSTAVFGGVALGVLIVAPVAALLIWGAPHFLRTPPGTETALRWLLMGTLGAFLLGFLNNFGIVAFARNRLDALSVADCLSVLSRVGVVVLLFALLGPSVWHVGMGFLAGAAVLLVGYAVAWRLLAPAVRLVWSAFSLSKLREMLGMSGWMSINALGGIIFLQVDLLLINRIVGPEAGGAYGAVLQWSALLRTLSYVVAGVVDPTLIGRFGQADEEGMLRLARQAVKLLGLLLALPIGLICGLSGPLLTTWLGADFAGYWKLMWVLNLHLATNLVVRPMNTTNIARDQVRWPAVATLVAGLGNVALAILLAGRLGWGMYGVAAAGAIALTLRNSVFQPIYTSMATGRGPLVFFPCLLWPLAAASGLGLGTSYLASVVDLSGWPRLMATGTAAALVYAAVTYKLALSAEDRRSLALFLRPGRKPEGATAGAGGDVPLP